ncbi:MAG: hypothetical protein HUU48_01855 [Flavobacteriales bacterium]|nr:hypothetical protein [Flavobacteriales bacterium]
MSKHFFVAIATLLFFVSFVSAQCKSYTKKYCFPSLAPYTHNGQFNGAVLMPGEVAEMNITFSSGKEYRLLVCSHETIGQSTFKVLDEKRNELYNSEGKNKNYWDFKVENTQQLIIQINVPYKKPLNNILPSGCVSVLIGFTR